MDVNISDIRGYGDFGRMEAAKKQSQFKANRQPLAGNPRHEILNPNQGDLTEGDLKKQSQLHEGQNGLIQLLIKML